MDVQEPFGMIDAQSAPKLALAEEIVERDSRSYRDALPELLPSVAPIVQCVSQMLMKN